MKATVKAMIPALALVGVLLLAPAAQANDRHGNPISGDDDHHWMIDRSR